MINEGFEIILVPEDNEKQNPNETYKIKYQKHVACSCGCKLVCVDDKFSEPFKWYLGEDDVFNFINSMVEESKYCSDVIKKNYNKELKMTKNDNEDFKNFTKWWICDNEYVNDDVNNNDEVLHIEIAVLRLN